MHQYRVRKVAARGIFVQLTDEYGPRADTEAGIRLTEATTLHLVHAVRDRLGTDGVHELAQACEPASNSPASPIPRRRFGSWTS